MLENIEAIIFDLDGTLVDSMWVWTAIDDEFFRKIWFDTAGEFFMKEWKEKVIRKQQHIFWNCFQTFHTH